jgi:hypothetical protein
MDLTKVGDLKWNVDQTKKQAPDPTGAKHIGGFKKDMKTIKDSNSVNDMLVVKRAKNKRQFLTDP